MLSIFPSPSLRFARRSPLLSGDAAKERETRESEREKKKSRRGEDRKGSRAEWKKRLSSKATRGDLRARRTASTSVAIAPTHGAYGGNAFPLLDVVNANVTRVGGLAALRILEILRPL